jgi:small-conductance mechanosensitive channel/CRP-like cAMP-binding protein
MASTYYKDLLFGLLLPETYCLMVLVGRHLKRKHGVRLGWLYHLFALGCAVYGPAFALKLDWSFVPYVGGATLILGAAFLMALLDRYVWELYFKQRLQIKVPKFLTEVVRLAILLVIGFLVLKFKYHINLNSLLFTSGFAAVILGLAMQDTVGNIISGFALQIGQPYRHGDWLLIDNRPAEVIEINWRATGLKTLDDVVIEIPHRLMAGQTIVNLSRPTRRHAMRLSVGIDYAAPPTRVKDLLWRAAANAKGVAPEPEPRVYLKDYGDSAIEYEIKFWLDDHSAYHAVCDAIRTNIWYSLQRQGIRIPFPIRTVQLERPARGKQQEVQATARVLLRQHALFQSLTETQQEALLARGRVVHFGRGERLIRQGEKGRSMFILVNGEANVLVDRHGLQTHVASLTSGNCVGEMSLLTGEARTATVVADTDCEVVEIHQGTLAESLRDHPELLTKLSELLARRQMETEGILASRLKASAIKAKETEYQAGFVDKLRKIFEL